MAVNERIMNLLSDSYPIILSMVEIKYSKLL